MALPAPPVHRMYWAAGLAPMLTIFRCTPLSCWEGGAKNMIKWNYRTMRIALVLGAIAAFAVSAGANTKWAV